MDGNRGADANGASDPFSRFWLDLMSKMSTAGFGPTVATPPGPSQADALKHMRQAFFDAWAHHCDEFLRSPAFLEAMKKSMDNALAFKQQLNEFMTKALHEQQMPARSDTDSILLVLRSLEDRVLKRIDELSQRVERLESRVSASTPPAPPPPAARRPKGVTK